MFLGRSVFSLGFEVNEPKTLPFGSKVVQLTVPPFAANSHVPLRVPIRRKTWRKRCITLRTWNGCKTSSQGNGP